MPDMKRMISEVAGSARAPPPSAIAECPRVSARQHPISPSPLCRALTRPSRAGSPQISYAVPTVDRLLQE